MVGSAGGESAGWTSAGAGPRIPGFAGRIGGAPEGLRAPYDSGMFRSADASLADYDFVAPPQIRFGAGAVDRLAEVVGTWGRRVWIVAGRHGSASGGPGPRVQAGLQAAGIPARVVATTAGEPTVDHVAAALAALAGEDHRDVVVVAIGGGAAIDLGKAVAALVTNTADAWHGTAEDGLFDELVVDRLEGVGRGIAIDRWPLPLIAVPTTAGTGAEATRNAVISCPRRRFKKSLRSPLMVPRAAVVDPDLIGSCDTATTAASGLDAITQLVESFICRFRKPLPRALVLDALPRAVHALPRLLENPAARGTAARAAERAAMSHAALVSGMALANSGLGLAHGVAAALGVAHDTPHGLACAVMLPVAVRVNRDVAAADFALLERAVDPDASRQEAEAADAFVGRIERLCGDAGIPRRLSDLGVGAGDLDWLAEQSFGSSMRGNPTDIGVQRLRDLLAAML